MRKTKRYADGGATIVFGGQQSPSIDPTLSTASGSGSGYPFAGTSSGAGAGTNTSTNNITVGAQPAVEQPMFKKGGKVSSPTRRSVDGCAQRGKTRGRMV